MDREKIFTQINNLSWFIGDWEEQVWKMAINGLMDYTKKKNIHGFCDGHIHLDRCFTYEQKFLPPGINLNEIADLPLQVKQDLIGYLHDGPAYGEKSLKQRMVKQIERAGQIGTREMWAVIDTTPDIGLRAFRLAKKLQQHYSEHIDLKIGCYAVFGLKNPLINNDRLSLMAEAAETADFIVGLPEKDEEETRIGFKGQVNLLLEMGYSTKKEVHIHVDQANSDAQKETFKVIECLEGLIPEKLVWYKSPGRPKLWCVHVISPSCYNPEEFTRLINLLLKYNIGVICCPVAAISMRELRSEYSPIHNSIARVTELLRAGVKMSFGTDNVNDIFVPSGNGLILREIAEVSNFIRNYAAHILVKVGMGIDLNKGDRAILARALYEKRKSYLRHEENIKKIIEKNYQIVFDF